MAVEKKTTEKIIHFVREVVPGLKDKTAGMYAHLRENPKEFLTQKPVAWTLGSIGLIVGALLLIVFYQWLEGCPAEKIKGDKSYHQASKVQSLLGISDSTGKEVIIRGENLNGNGPFEDPETGNKDVWRALLTPDGQYYSAKPGPDGQPVVPPPLPTPTPQPTAIPQPMRPPL